MTPARGCVQADQVTFQQILLGCLMKTNLALMLHAGAAQFKQLFFGDWPELV